MKFKILLGFLLVSCLSTTFAMLPIQVSADTLLRTDFNKESFAKTVDYFEYARAWALLHGLPRPANYWHANVYMTYVNMMGLKMLYTGLCNISLANQAYLTIPTQTLLMCYKTENNSRDTLVASSFLMLMGFNDTANSIHSNWPDRNDNLWASFSFGVNLHAIFPNLTLPAFNSKAEIFPLTPSQDRLTWKWGMKYTNLTALWITTSITNDSETQTSRPFGLATYEELTFNYTLTIDPVTHKATISQDYAIGRIRGLWIFWGWFIVPLYDHYNSSGCYRYSSKVSNENVYQFLQRHNVKMSIVNYQTSIVLDRNTYSRSADGQNVTNNDILVSNSSISTFSEDGEKIFDTVFGVKKNYNLFNYTEDPTESTPHSYNAIARSTEIDGYARNRNLFNYHRNFALYLPLILIHMYPNLYQRAKETITNMTRADYLYLISYANYSGYRIEHDPTYTVYFAPNAAALPPNLGGLLLVGALVGIITVAAVVILRRKSAKKPPEPQLPPSPSTI